MYDGKVIHIFLGIFSAWTYYSRTSKLNSVEKQQPQWDIQSHTYITHLPKELTYFPKQELGSPCCFWCTCHNLSLKQSLRGSISTRNNADHVGVRNSCISFHLWTLTPYAISSFILTKALIVLGCSGSRHPFASSQAMYHTPLPFCRHWPLDLDLV